jgi:hypothetical protein
MPRSIICPGVMARGRRRCLVRAIGRLCLDAPLCGNALPGADGAVLYTREAYDGARFTRVCVRRDLALAAPPMTKVAGLCDAAPLEDGLPVGREVVPAAGVGRLAFQGDAHVRPSEDRVLRRCGSRVAGGVCSALVRGLTAVGLKSHATMRGFQAPGTGGVDGGGLGGARFPSRLG